MLKHSYNDHVVGPLLLPLLKYIPIINSIHRNST